MKLSNKITGTLGAVVGALVSYAHAQKPIRASSPSPTVFVHGLVAGNSAKLWTPELTLKDVVRLAGDFGVKLDRIAIIRGGKRITVELSSLASGALANPKLQPDDTIEIPDVGTHPGWATIVRGGERIQVSRRDALTIAETSKLQPNDIVIFNSVFF